MSDNTDIKWVCMACDWSGDAARFDQRKQEIQCPECGSTLDDSVRQTIKARDGETPDEYERGAAICPACSWSVPVDEMDEQDDPVELYMAHFREEHAELLEGTRYE